MTFSSTEVLASLGVLLVVAGLGWRAHQRGASDKALREALWSPDRQERRAAVEVAGSQSLRHHGPLLSQWIVFEEDPELLRAMAKVIDANQWEPATEPLVTQLRLWARRTAAAGSERLDASRDPSGGDASGPASAYPMVAPSGGPAHPPVLVTGAGGPAGVAVIQALRAKGVAVVGADSDPCAVGFRLCRLSGRIPRADEPDFVESLAALARQTGATALITTVAEEIGPLWHGRQVLDESGLQRWLPPVDAVESCLDKWAFHQVTSSAGLPVPATALGEVGDVPGPWIVKPRFGRGSRDVISVDDADELRWAIKRVPESLVQERLEGREFTVDVLVERGGTLVGAVPRWRDETRGGISTRGTTFTDERLVGMVATMMHTLGLEGPANVQGFAGDDGVVAFTEVNPRFSGGLPLSLAAGADLVGEYLRGVQGRALRSSQLRHRPGVTMMRHFTEVFEQ